MDTEFVFTASRMTEGNFLFPSRIEISPERVSHVRPRMMGSNEESIAISKVASVSIQTGLLWSEVRIDSTGGSSPMISRGHRKADAQAMRDLIEKFQRDASKTP